jgi:hypothetical protein
MTRPWERQATDPVVRRASGPWRGKSKQGATEPNWHGGVPVPGTNWSTKMPSFLAFLLQEDRATMTGHPVMGDRRDV